MSGKLPELRITHPETAVALTIVQQRLLEHFVGVPARSQRVTYLDNTRGARGVRIQASTLDTPHVLDPEAQPREFRALRAELWVPDPDDPGISAGSFVFEKGHDFDFGPIRTRATSKNTHSILIVTPRSEPRFLPRWRVPHYEEGYLLGQVGRTTNMRIHNRVTGETTRMRLHAPIQETRIEEPKQIVDFFRRALQSMQLG